MPASSMATTTLENKIKNQLYSVMTDNIKLLYIDLFCGAGMLAKRANMVKYLVSIGNLLWMLNGILTSNVPLVVSNGFCLLVMGWDIFKNYKNQKDDEQNITDGR